MSDKQKYTYKVEELEDNKYKVNVTVDKVTFTAYREETYQRLAKEVKIDGFRKGKAPRNKIEEKLGRSLQIETLEAILPNIAAEIVEKEEFNPVTQLKYDLNDDKEKKAEEFEYSFEFTNYPEVTVPEISEIEVEVVQDEEVEEQEIIDVIERLYRNELEAEQAQDEQKDEDDDGTEAEDQQKEFSIDEVSDKMVKKWDINGAKTVDELKEQIKERLEQVKQQQNTRQLENAIVDKLEEVAEVEVPKALVDQQAEQLTKQHLSRIEDLEIDKDQFLKAQGLTEEKLREQKQEEARKQITLDLILNEIARDKELIPTADEIEAQIEAITDEETKNQMDSYQGRRYILSRLIQQNAMQELLDNVKVKKVAPEKEAKKKKSESKSKKKKSKKTKKAA